MLPDQGNWHDNFLDRWQVKMQLFDLYGALPAAGDRHLAEFFPYFLTPETDYGAEVGVGLTTIPDRQRQVAQARENVHNAIAGDLPPVTRSAEATAEIVSAVANGRGSRSFPAPALIPETTRQRRSRRRLRSCCSLADSSSQKASLSSLRRHGSCEQVVRPHVSSFVEPLSGTIPRRFRRTASAPGLRRGQ